MNEQVYLDYAATTPIDSRVLEAMRPYWQENFYNPSSLYQPAREARKDLEAARAKVADLMGAKKSEIIFTAGGTESINLALFGVATNFPNAKIVTIAIEHDAVLESVRELARRGHKLEVVGVKPDGIVDVAQVIKNIDDETVLVSVMYANNEIGTIQPVAAIAKELTNIKADRMKRGVDLPLYFHTDACQAPGYLDLHVSRLGVDLMTLNGSKIYGPKQTGCLYVRTGTDLKPVIYGGGQEKSLRSGTEDVAGSTGFAIALELAQVEREAESRRLIGLRNYLATELYKIFPDLKLNGHAVKRLPNNINITIPGIDGEAAVMYLDKEGILTSTGSACSTGDVDPSHVLLAIGLTEAEAGGSLRFTLGRDTSKEQIDYLLKVLPQVVRKLKQIG